MRLLLGDGYGIGTICKSTDSNGNAGIYGLIAVGIIPGKAVHCIVDHSALSEEAVAFVD